MIADLNAMEDDLLKIREEKHEKWKKSKPDHTTTETQPHQKLEVTSTNAITTLLDNTNKLLGSIDVKRYYISPERSNIEHRKTTEKI